MVDRQLQEQCNNPNKQKQMTVKQLCGKHRLQQQRQHEQTLIGIAIRNWFSRTKRKSEKSNASTNLCKNVIAMLIARYTTALIATLHDWMRSITTAKNSQLSTGWYHSRISMRQMMTHASLKKHVSSFVSTKVWDTWWHMFLQWSMRHH